MPEIYEPTQFPFEKIHLGTPFNKNGSYFIKLTVADDPIYIQSPKCSIRQGFIVSGKKTFCDLMFDIEDNSFLAWMESVEEIAKTQIYENRGKWFETDLDRHDIENSVVSPYKMYKSGKMFIVRANIPNTLGKHTLKIYDENEREVLPENIKEDTHVIPILEFRGIKCSVRSFQFEVDVRQMLVVSPVKLFERCVIKKNANSKLDEPSSTSVEKEEETHTRQVLEETLTEPPLAEKEVPPSPSLPEEPMAPPLRDSIQLPLLAANETELCEIDLDLDKIELNETVQLKKRNDVYYKMYKDAKQKAREAKMIALSNYLEAKRIKNTYLLEDSSEDESDNDLEETNGELF